jgi:hypothetical protein
MNKLEHRIFNITWIKKDGSTRNANVRLNVTKHLNGGDGQPPTTSYLPVYLMPKMTGRSFLFEKGYRLVNLDTVLTVNADDCRLTVIPEPTTLRINDGKPRKKIITKQT